MMSPARTALLGTLLAVLAAPLPCFAQLESRAQQFEVLRRDKMAKLWPEKQSQIVIMANNMIGRVDGSGEGTNGFQAAILGGMRAGQGFTYGIGYRRTDLLHDRVAFRVTARASLYKAYMFDLTGGFPGLIGRRGFLEYEVKYENSPRMDFYGLGTDSKKEDRTSYRLEDTDFRLQMGYLFTRRFSAAAEVGGYFPNIGRGRRVGVPSIEQVFDPADVPGMEQQTNYFRWGANVNYDTRDNPSVPSSGGRYYLRFSHYKDRTLNRNGFMRLTGFAEHFYPYRNATRVVALRLEGRLAFVNEDKGQSVPFYLQPTLGGNNRLRGFGDYRFYDKSSLLLIAEHQWYVFSGMDAAAFVEVGAVANKNTTLSSRARWSGGLSMRFKMFDRFFMRFDNAVSSEGYRWIMTFTDVFNLEDRW